MESGCRDIEHVNQGENPPFSTVQFDLSSANNSNRGSIHTMDLMHWDQYKLKKDRVHW